MISKPLLDDSTSPLLNSRPLELYVFIDPNCHDCWQLQPILRRLQIDYERYFTLRVILRTPLTSLNSACTPSIEQCETMQHPVFPSIAIKAAEFQGKRAGFKFTSKLFEHLYLKNDNVSTFDMLLNIAESVNLDLDEFTKDFHSKNVHRALQIDLYMAQEMDVIEAPTFVFFNGNIEDEGLKVSGLYSYHIYEQIIEELLGQSIFPNPPPPLEELFKRFELLATNEIADIYQTSIPYVERELKKRVLQQSLERVTFNNTTMWKRKKYTVMN